MLPISVYFESNISINANYSYKDGCITLVNKMLSLQKLLCNESQG